MTAEAEYAAVPITVTVNGVKARRRGRTAHAAGLFPARAFGPDRNSCRLRHQPVRRLHGASRWPGGEVLHDSRRAGQRRRDKNHRRPRRRRYFSSRAGRLPRKTWTAVRLLHAGHDHDGCAFVGNELEPNRRRDQARARRQYLPLHRLRQYRRIGQMGSSQDGRKKCFPLVSATSQRARSKKRWN